MNTALIYVANFKMQLSFARTIAYVQEYALIWADIMKSADSQMIICPSFDVLSCVKALLANDRVQLGAQDCSSFEAGPYTGQVSAQSLAEIGCSYCIVGHSETRRVLAQSDELIAQKVLCLVRVGITPIICVGEEQRTEQPAQLEHYLSTQLVPILKKLSELNNPIVVSIAYEPVWAIGTGRTPEPEYIEYVLDTIKGLWVDQCSQHTLQLLYGGSVSEANADSIKQIRGLNGLLIGGASLDFKKFESIVC